VGKHTITTPLLKEVTKGTLNGILNKVSLFNNLGKGELTNRLKLG